MRQFSPHVFGWSATDPETNIASNAWYVQVDGETVLIDPLDPTEELLNFIDVRGQPDCVILTSAAQTRATQSFQDLFDCPVWIHEADEHRATLPIDRTFADDDVLSCGLRVVQLHHQRTPGESALYLAGLPAVMIVGSALISAASSLEMLPAQEYENAQDARMALSRLLEIDFDQLLCAYGRPIEREAHAIVRNFLSNA